MRYGALAALHAGVRLRRIDLSIAQHDRRAHHPALAARTLRAAWARASRVLRREGYLATYVAAIQCHHHDGRRVRPHLHLLVTGRFIPHPRLCAVARESGLGYPWVEEVGQTIPDARQVGWYLTRTLGLDNWLLRRHGWGGRAISYSAGWPRTPGADHVTARQERYEAALDVRRARDVLDLAAAVGFDSGEGRDDEADILVLGSKQLIAHAERFRHRGGALELLAASLLAIAGPPEGAIRTDGREAARVASLDAAAFDAECAAAFPPWVPDVAILALAARPDLRGPWEWHRRLYVDRLVPDGSSDPLARWPRFDDLDLPDPDPPQGGDSK